MSLNKNVHSDEDHVIITGTSDGIGKSTAIHYLSKGYKVVGIDIQESSITDSNYTHYQADILIDELPDVRNVCTLINNAGVQNSGNDIDVNLKGLIRVTEKYGLQPYIKSIVNLASVSAHNGCEFPQYCASKGGVLSYTRWTAKEVAKYSATCNSLSFGGVTTELNAHVINDTTLWSTIMELTPLKKWCSAEEAAQWIFFVAEVNKSMSGQDIIVDNLETLNGKFVW